MQIELLAYITTFIISSGLAVIGISISYQVYQNHRNQIFQTLLYQQIFLYSFSIYGIWGNIILRKIFSDFNLSAEIMNKLAVFIPFIGIPFLLASWFMLLKFGFTLNGYKITRAFAFSYFLVLILIPFGIVLAIQQNYILVPTKPDLFIIQILLLINLLIHVILLFSILKPRSSEFHNSFIFSRKYLLIYMAGVIFYSIVLNFFQLFGYFSTCFSILVLFGINILIPLIFKMKLKPKPLQYEKKNTDFKLFCDDYEISKREAEIILEICSGKTNKAISEKLFITLQTVKDHTHRIYTKTGVKSRVQLANLVHVKTSEKV
jgi:DNA-binding CsgD family transcriptional regulator